MAKNNFVTGKVESSNINKVRYDKQRKLLRVFFHNGSVYDYKEVSEEEFDALCKAESVGKHFNSEIKNNKEFNKIK
jgi:hypothetical protein